MMLQNYKQAFTVRTMKNKHAAALGRLGGSVKSKAKSEASRKTLAKARKSRWPDREIVESPGR